MLSLVVATITTNVTSVSAQTFDLTSKYGLKMDSVTNTATNYDSIKVIAAYSWMAVQPTVTKVSGTLTSNTNVLLQGSIDGVSWVTVNAADTLHITNVTTPISTVWILSETEANSYLFYRVKYTGYGTMVATLKAKAIFKNKRLPNQ